MGRASRRKQEHRQLTRRWNKHEQPRLRRLMEDAMASSEDPSHLVARFLVGEWIADTVGNQAIANMLMEMTLKQGKGPENPTDQDKAYQVKRWLEHQAEIMNRRMPVDEVRRMIRPGPRLLELLRVR